MKKQLLWLLMPLFFAPLQALSAERIVTLSPHLTEWVYSLAAQDRLVGVSAFSDYPAQAAELRRLQAVMAARR